MSGLAAHTSPSPLLTHVDYRMDMPAGVCLISTSFIFTMHSFLCTGRAAKGNKNRSLAISHEIAIVWDRYPDRSVDAKGD
jgi:hypothetical protein